MTLKVPKHLVSVDWLYENFTNENLIVLESILTKVTLKDKQENEEQFQVSGAIQFDIKNTFSDTIAAFPNTVPSSEKFQEEAQKLGITKNSIIVVYDTYGIYSSPRVWWLFQLMGFQNIAVLNGGFPEWKKKNYPVEEKKNIQFKQSNFITDYQSNKIVFKEDVLSNVDTKNSIVLDARSEDRFNSKVPEPRKGVRNGRIPNSKNLPYTKLLENNLFKSKDKLLEIFSELNPEQKNMIFSCGTGITASILALGAELSGYKKTAVYDGSWTEWGSTEGLPIEK